MLGITLAPEQIMQAPPEVRRWIEQQVAGAFGLSRPAPVVEPPCRHRRSMALGKARQQLNPATRGRLPPAGASRTRVRRYP